MRHNNAKWKKERKKKKSNQIELLCEQFVSNSWFSRCISFPQYAFSPTLVFHEILLFISLAKCYWLSIKLFQISFVTFSNNLMYCSKKRMHWNFDGPKQTHKTYRTEKKLDVLSKRQTFHCNYTLNEILRHELIIAQIPNKHCTSVQLIWSCSCYSNLHIDDKIVSLIVQFEIWPFYHFACGALLYVVKPELVLFSISYRPKSLNCR